MPFQFGFVALLAQYSLTVVTAAGAAWALFQLLGVKWIENKFQKELAAFEHAKNREIEELRGQVNALLDRTVKLHALEFEVLAKVWDKLSEAFGAVTRFTSALQTYPVVQRMNDEQLDAFLEKSQLEPIERAQIRQASRGDRESKYIEYIFWHHLNDAERQRGKFHNYFIANGIFIQPVLKEKCRTLSNIMWSALQERAFDRDSRESGPDRFVAGDKFNRDGMALYMEIEGDVQARLWDRKLSTEPLEDAEDRG